MIFFEPKRRYWEKAEVDVERGRPGAADGPGRVVRAGHRRDPRCATARWCAPAWSGRGGRGGRPQHRGDRPALALAAGHRRRRRLGRADRPVVVVHEAPVPRSARRSRPGSASACFYRLEAPVLRVGGFTSRTRRPGSRSLPARPRPGAGRRRPRVRLLIEGAETDLKQFRLPDVGEGLTEAEILTWSVEPGDTYRQSDHRGDRDGQGGRRTAHRRSRAWCAAAGRAGADGRRGYPDHLHRTSAPRAARRRPTPAPEPAQRAISASGVSSRRRRVEAVDPACRARRPAARRRSSATASLGTTSSGPASPPAGRRRLRRPRPPPVHRAAVRQPPRRPGGRRPRRRAGQAAGAQARQGPRRRPGRAQPARPDGSITREDVEQAAARARPARPGAGSDRRASRPAGRGPRSRSRACGSSPRPRWWPRPSPRRTSPSSCTLDVTRR